MQLSLPSFTPDQLAPGRFVHRRQLREVLITEARRLSDDYFALGAQWPREHPFYSPHERRADSALVAETIRQVTILLAHTMYGVPLDAAFLMPSLSAKTIAAPAPWSEDEIMVQAQVVASGRAQEGPASMRVSVRIEGGGQILGEGIGHARIIAPEAYARLRRNRPKRPIAVHARALQSRGRLLQWGRADRPVVVVDETDPVFFDHPLDHVPGMLLLEAVREGVRNLMRPHEVDLTSFDLAFARVVEFEPEITLEVDRCRQGHFAVALRQDGITCVHGFAGAED